ncbi:MAG TPA: hypothetical protein VEC01_16880 [Noviherbaspirillum sp.]|uniref:hypothetical protein n=1 Tax=Noviherbaspirillum sp. TaxID=1926288 RepID=UPI002D751A62|nr:hypothetical protein [Noviherbaspirillum sp.]HYD97006.1 hypothetical protein [Noviherbaspirillum sp.]
MLLRDERQTALNAVEKLCLETAHRYETAVKDLADDPLSGVCLTLSEERKRLWDELAVHIRALDDLPQTPDPDREAAVHLLSAIKGLLTGDARAALLADCARLEEALADAIRAALEQDLGTEPRDTLQRLLAHTDKARRELHATGD